MKNGFIKVAAATPKIRVADPAYNVGELIRIAADAGKDDALAAAHADERIAAQLAGKTIVKEIYVPGKIVNIVAK